MNSIGFRARLKWVTSLILSAWRKACRILFPIFYIILTFWWLSWIRVSHKIQIQGYCRELKQFIRNSVESIWHKDPLNLFKNHWQESRNRDTIISYQECAASPREMTYTMKKDNNPPSKIQKSILKK